LVEFGDYECPYCGQAFPIVERLRVTFSDSLLFVFRNFPLSDMHPHAEAAAEVAEAVGLQGKFWEIHEALYENQRNLNESALLRYIKEVGADVEQVAKDIASGAPRGRVAADIESGIRSGANGTPTFFLNGVRYDGSWLYDPFAEILEATLENQ
jgi:protein-disulfide isomerase